MEADGTEERPRTAREQPFLSASLCLSRACLGNIISFSIKSGGTAAFLPGATDAERVGAPTVPQHRAAGTAGRLLARSARHIPVVGCRRTLSAVLRPLVVDTVVEHPVDAVQRSDPAGKTPLFSTFPYVCPEPVLVQ